MEPMSDPVIPRTPEDLMRRAADLGHVVTVTRGKPGHARRFAWTLTCTCGQPFKEYGSQRGAGRALAIHFGVVVGNATGDDLADRWIGPTPEQERAARRRKQRELYVETQERLRQEATGT